MLFFTRQRSISYNWPVPPRMCSKKISHKDEISLVCARTQWQFSAREGRRRAVPGSNLCNYWTTTRRLGSGAERKAFHGVFITYF